jgi:F420-dependent oxidoreductase-like protein
MDLRVFTEPQQGATYAQLRNVAQAAEHLGFSGFFRSDHYCSMGDVDPRPGPTDAWVTLAGLAVETTSIRLGTLMSAATFRLPGPFSIQVAQVDQMSEGRIELGIGTGWYELEHRAWGIPFPPLAERFERLQEQLEILTGIWSCPDGAHFDFAGRYWTLEHCPALPKPHQQPHPPILVGGKGPRRTPALAARYAAELNLPFPDLDQVRPLFEAADQACLAVGRDPATLTRSVTLVVCAGQSEAEVQRRAAAIGREVDELRRNGLAGSPAEIADRLGAFAKVGAERCYLQILDLDDLEHLDLLGTEVLPAVAC